MFLIESDAKQVIDNKNRSNLAGRRMDLKNILAFSVGAKGDLERADFAMPSSFPTQTCSGFHAPVEDALIAACGTDGLTKLALGSGRLSIANLGRTCLQAR